jgi:thioredoxin 1
MKTKNANIVNDGEPEETVMELTEHDFDFYIGQSALPVLVDFWAPWCGPCQMIAPVLERMAEEFAGRAVVTKVNVDDEPGLAQRFGIRSIPTMILFVDGEPVDRINGVVPAEVIASKLREHAR